MTKRVLVALGLVAAVIILLLLYFFYSGGLRLTGLEKPKEPAVKYQVTPETKEKPGVKPAPPSGPPSPEKPQLPPPKPGAPPEKPVTKPEAAAPGPPEPELAPLKPKEEYGILAGSFRKYGRAGRKMEQLKKKGLPAFIRRHKGRYQVWVGPFSTAKEAQAAAKALKGKRKRAPKIQKLIIPVPK